MFIGQLENCDHLGGRFGKHDGLGWEFFLHSIRSVRFDLYRIDNDIFLANDAAQLFQNFRP